MNTGTRDSGAATLHLPKHVHRSKDDSPFAPFHLVDIDQLLNAKHRTHGATEYYKAKPC
jgi:hypothetical protein